MNTTTDLYSESQNWWWRVLSAEERTKFKRLYYPGFDHPGLLPENHVYHIWTMECNNP